MKKKLVILLVFFLLLCCSKNWANAEEEVLATFNGQKLIISEFNLLSQRPTDYGKRPTRKKEKEEFLRLIIASSLIAPKVKKLGMHEDPIIKQKFKAVREYLLDFFLRERIRKQTVIIDDNNYKNYLRPYEQGKVRFREIVVPTRLEAEEIFQAILNGRDFETLAKERSINKYSKNGGDTGFVIKGRDTFPEEVENIIFKLKSGKVSEILKTREGYAIFKSVERKDLTEQEREKVIRILQWKLINENTEALLENHRSKANIEIFSDNIKKIQELNNLNDDPLPIELARVNNTTIKLVDVLLSEAKTPFYHPLRARHLCTPFFMDKMKMIDNKIDKIFMANEAVRIGLDKDPKFQNLLKRFKEWHLGVKFVTEVLSKDVTCSEEEIKKFYDEHKVSPKYKNLPELVHYRVILLDNENLAKQVWRRLKNGADFDKMARNYSIHDTSSKFGGDRGYRGRGQGKWMTKDRDKEILFGLSVGEISDIIESKPGASPGGIVYQDDSIPTFYKIYKVEDKIKEGENSYNEIKGLMKKELLDKKREEKISDFIDQLLATVTIKIHSDLLNNNI